MTMVDFFQLTLLISAKAFKTMLGYLKGIAKAVSMAISGSCNKYKLPMLLSCYVFMQRPNIEASMKEKKNTELINECDVIVIRL